MLYKFKSYGTEETGRSIKAFYGVRIVTFLVILLQYIRNGRKGQVNKSILWGRNRYFSCYISLNHTERKKISGQLKHFMG